MIDAVPANAAGGCVCACHCGPVFVYISANAAVNCCICPPLRPVFVYLSAFLRCALVVFVIDFVIDEQNHLW